jgi:bisanhydrobacterioruberin hydratase
MRVDSQTKIALAIVLFNIVGIIGFSIHTLQPLFLKIVPFYLLLMGVLVMISHKPLNIRFFIFFLLIYPISFFAEWIGVHKGWLFGHYHYGTTLGLKMWNIPLLIGLNWFLLIYSAGITTRCIGIKNSTARIIAGAAVLLLLDLLIEPVAIRFNYWHWLGNRAPWYNYLCWFLLSCGLLAVFERFKFVKQGMVAVMFLGMQFAFFGVLILEMGGLR